MPCRGCQIGCQRVFLADESRELRSRRADSNCRPAVYEISLRGFRAIPFGSFLRLLVRFGADAFPFVPCICGQNCGQALPPRTVSRTAAASRCIVGITCEYVSRVMATE